MVTAGDWLLDVGGHIRETWFHQATRQRSSLAAARRIIRWERNWERTLLAAARWCSAVLAPARFRRSGVPSSPTDLIATIEPELLCIRQRDQLIAGPGQPDP